MRKRSFQFLVFGLIVLASVLGASVGLMLYLEHAPGIRRTTHVLHSAESADWQNRYYEASALFHQGQLTEADRMVQKLLTERPGAVEAWQLQGLIAFRRGFYSDAERAFRRQLHLQPSNASGFSNLSQTLIRLDRKEEALATARHAVKLAPENGSIALSAASIAAAAGAEEEAVQLLQRALRAGVSPEAVSRNPALVKLLNEPRVLDSLRDSEVAAALAPEKGK